MEMRSKDIKLIRAFDELLDVAKARQMTESIKCFEGWSDERKVSYMKAWKVTLPEGTKAPDLQPMTPDLKPVDIPDSVLCDVTHDDTAQGNYINSVGHYRSWQYKGSDFRLEFGTEQRRSFVTRSSGTFIFYFRYKDYLVGLVIDGQTGYVEGCLTRVYQDGNLVQEHVLQFKRDWKQSDYIKSKRTHNLKFSGSYTEALKIYQVQLNAARLRRAIKKVAKFRPNVDRDEPSSILFQILIVYAAEAPRIRGVFRTTARSLSPEDLGTEGLAIIRILEPEEPFVLNYRQLSTSALDAMETKIFRRVSGTAPRNLFHILSSVTILRRRKTYRTKFYMPDVSENEPEEPHEEQWGSQTLEAKHLRLLNIKGTQYSSHSHGGERPYQTEQWIIDLWEDSCLDWSKVDVWCSSGNLARLAIPNGASTGVYEALESRDGGSDYLGKGVSELGTAMSLAVCKPGTIIKTMPLYQDRMAPTLIGNFIIQQLNGTKNEWTCCKQKLNSKSILAASLAVCKAGARIKKISSCQHIFPPYGAISGGFHVGNEVNNVGDEGDLPPDIQDDWVHYAKMTVEIGEQVQIVDNGLLVTSPTANENGSVNESIEAVQTSKHGSCNVMACFKSGDTEDMLIADLAVGLATCQIRTRASCRSERLAKYNKELGVVVVSAGA